MQNLSYRKLSLLVFGPMMADLLTAMFLFWMNLTAVRLGVPPKLQSLIGGLFAVGYTLSAHFAGRWCTPARATRLLIGDVVLLAAFGTVCLLTTSFPAFLVLAFAVGAVAGHYFVPFQVKMGDVRPFATMAWTVAFYQISWGTGYAIGPFLGGWLRAKSSLWLIGTAWLLTVLQVVLVVAADRKHAATSTGAKPAPHEFSSTVAQRRIGWISIFAGCTLFAGLLSTLWPGLGAARGLTDRQIGIGIFVTAIAIPLASLVCARLRRWMAHPWFLAGLVLASGVTFALLRWVAAWPASLVCLFLFGASYTGVIFHAIYYCNADPVQPGRSVGINETVIGLGSVAGPLLVGWLAWDDPASPRPYLCGLALMVATVLFIPVLWRGRDASALGQ